MIEFHPRKYSGLLYLKRFDNPDEIRKFDKGSFEIVTLSDMTIGRATYAPGWKWSMDVSPLADTEFCEVEHLGMVLSGSATVAFKDGKIHVMRTVYIVLLSLRLGNGKTIYYR